jgi:hypothetical protein
VLALVLLVSGRLDWQELRQLPALSLGALALSALTLLWIVKPSTPP